MPHSLLQKILLLERGVIEAAEHILQFRQLAGDGFDRLRWKKVTEALQEIAHFFAIDAHRVDQSVGSFCGDRFAGFANTAEALQDSFGGNFSDRSRGVGGGFCGAGRTPCCLKRGDLLFIDLGAEEISHLPGFKLAFGLKPLKEGVTKEEAAEIKKKIEAAGAKVDIK
jgi:hypothetical protein